MASRHLFPTSLALAFALVLAGGCQSDTDDRDDTHDAPTTTDAAERTAARYLHYAYQGALLSSDHPLSDSLTALVDKPMMGPTVAVVDTFRLGSAQPAADSGYTVRATFPRSVRVTSGSWRASAPATDSSYTLHVTADSVYRGPTIVGWPAFRSHVRNVVPAETADSLLHRVGKRLDARRPSV